MFQKLEYPGLLVPVQNRVLVGSSLQFRCQLGLLLEGEYFVQGVWDVGMRLFCSEVVDQADAQPHEQQNCQEDLDGQQAF